MGYTSIVCGVTGSVHAQEAALEAARLAKNHEARLTYVYAVDASFLKSGIALTGPVEESMMRLGAHIVEMAGQLALTLGVESKKVVKAGPVLEVLKSVIAEEKADLLVLGHEKRTFFEKSLFKGEVEDHVQELKQQTGVEVSVIK